MKMSSFGYTVCLRSATLSAMREFVDTLNTADCINWYKFNDRDIFYGNNGTAFIVFADHVRECIDLYHIVLNPII